MYILDVLVYFIVFVKICFMIFIFSDLYFKHVSKDEDTKAKLGPKVEYWRERTEFVFKVAMALMLVIIFNPRQKKLLLTKERCLLIFIYGIILFFSADWSWFFQNIPDFWSNIKIKEKTH
jgi:hypothetical protein